MSDEDIIKQRLLIDGDGTGDDRRLNVLLKQFLKWMYSKNESPENNQIIYDRLMAQLAQCQFAAIKTEQTNLMIEEELENYKKISSNIEKSIEIAKMEIEKSKNDLILAKQIRKNRIEYDQLAKIIKEQPNRKETQKNIDTLQEELLKLKEKKLKLERQFEKRRKDFTVLMYSIRELSSQLNEDDSNDVEDIKRNEQELATSSTIIEKSVPSVLEGLSDDDANNCSTSIKCDPKNTSEGMKELLDVKSETPMLVDEDAILELSIEKDDGELKIEETKDVST